MLLQTLQVTLLAQKGVGTRSHYTLGVPTRSQKSDFLPNSFSDPATWMFPCFPLESSVAHSAKQDIDAKNRELILTHS